MEYQNVGQLVQKLETDYVSGVGTQMSQYVRTDLYEDISTIYAYLNSKHTSGKKDSLDREKPFFNIVLSARNVWFRATDIDTKQIFAKPTKEKDVAGAFLLSVKLQEWMREVNFGRFLNSWGLVQAGFNSAVVKFVEKDGELVPSVVPWSRLIVDQVDFYSNPVIEVLELTEQQLYERYDKDEVDELIATKKARETLDKQRKDNKNHYYKVYETHGMFPVSFLTGEDKDDNVFSQQIHVVTYLKDKDGDDEDFTLYRGEEKQSPYMLTALLPSDDGSVSLDGSVKNLFEAQWMTNHTAKAVKDQLDLASKLIFQTADPRFLGQNAIQAIETGDILIHDYNRPITQVANNSHDITALQSQGQNWKALAAEINGISESMLGINPPSGSAWRQTEALLQESHSLFQIMTENRGLDIQEMMRRFVFPYLKKKLNTKDEVAATLDMYGIEQIEGRHVKYKSAKLRNKLVKQAVLEGKIPNVPTLEELEQGVKQELTDQGAYRFFKPDDLGTKTWKEILDTIEWDVEVDVTGESTDQQAVFTTLNTALQVAANPSFATNPTAQLIVGKILMETKKVSPMEWNETLNQTAQQAQEQPGGGKVPSEQLQELANQTNERQTTNV